MKPPHYWDIDKERCLYVDEKGEWLNTDTCLAFCGAWIDTSLCFRVGDLTGSEEVCTGCTFVRFLQEASAK